MLRSPERGIGLEGVTKKSSRIKEFKLSDAIVYSYFKDIRVVTLVCLLIGFSAWWILVPEQLLEGHQKSLCSPPDIARLVKDTFIDQVFVTSIMSAALATSGNQSIIRSEKTFLNWNSMIPSISLLVIE